MKRATLIGLYFIIQILILYIIQINLKKNYNVSSTKKRLFISPAFYINTFLLNGKTYDNGQHSPIFPSGGDTVLTVVTKTFVFR